MSYLTRFFSLASACLILFGIAHAGPVGDFEASLRSAYADYRNALFQTNANNPGEATKAVDGFIRKWSELATAYAAPPPHYADDPAYGETLAKVTDTAKKAAGQVTGGDLTRAHEILEGIREEIGALHERNGIVAFSDRMNAYHARMEEILAADYVGFSPVGQMEMIAQEPAGFSAEGLSILREDAAVLDYLAADLVAHPPADSSDPTYQPLLDAVVASVAALRKAARDANPDAAKAAVTGLKGPYSKLFLKFG
jgi:hypothetical protein